MLWMCFHRRRGWHAAHPSRARRFAASGPCHLLRRCRSTSPSALEQHSRRSSPARTLDQSSCNEASCQRCSRALQLHSARWSRVGDGAGVCRALLRFTLGSDFLPRRVPCPSRCARFDQCGVQHRAAFKGQASPTHSSNAGSPRRFGVVQGQLLARGAV